MLGGSTECSESVRDNPDPEILQLTPQGVGPREAPGDREPVALQGRDKRPHERPHERPLRHAPRSALAGNAPPGRDRHRHRIEARSSQPVNDGRSDAGGVHHEVGKTGKLGPRQEPPRNPPYRPARRWTRRRWRSSAGCRRGTAAARLVILETALSLGYLLVRKPYMLP